DEVLWAERIANRDIRPFNIHHFTDFERLKAFYGTMHLTPDDDELLVDTIHPLEHSLKRISDWIS
ncbi:MAG: hypothetical protein RI911_809, partial [Candidatus Parcubacteria bacterium]